MDSGGDTVYRAPSPKGTVCVCVCNSLFMGGNGIILKGGIREGGSGKGMGLMKRGRFWWEENLQGLRECKEE